jgi:hypothetical protein
MVLLNRGGVLDPGSGTLTDYYVTADLICISDVTFRFHVSCLVSACLPRLVLLECLP